MGQGQGMVNVLLQSAEDDKDDPFRRLRERNPLAPGASRGHQPTKRVGNTGG